MPEKKRFQMARDTRVILFVIILSLVLVGLWQSVLPWFAEYYYRVGFVANTYEKYTESAAALDRAFS